ncbi:MAG: hypothetical protein ACLQGJ_05350 [Candidatus Dormibacteria bacterium]
MWSATNCRVAMGMVSGDRTLRALSDLLPTLRRCWDELHAWVSWFVDRYHLADHVPPVLAAPPTTRR